MTKQKKNQILGSMDKVHSKATTNRKPLVKMTKRRKWHPTSRENISKKLILRSHVNDVLANNFFGKNFTNKICSL